MGCAVCNMEVSTVRIWTSGRVRRQPTLETWAAVAAAASAGTAPEDATVAEATTLETWAVVAAAPPARTSVPEDATAAEAIMHERVYAFARFQIYPALVLTAWLWTFILQT